MRKLFLDWETFYDSDQDYDLRELSTVEYTRHEWFKPHGFSYAFEQEAISWVSGTNARAVLSSFDWKNLVLIAQNAKFDGFILWDRFGFKPANYICTRAMSKALLGKRIKSHSLFEISKYLGLTPKDRSKLEAVDGVKDLTPEQEASLAEYCCDDTAICRGAFRIFEKDFPVSQYRPMSWTIKVFVEPKLVLDVPLLKKTAEEEKKRRETIFEEIGIPKETFASNVKFPELLRARGYDVPLKDSPKQKDEDGKAKRIPALALGDLGFVELCQTGNKELKDLCDARKAAKSTLLETRSDGLAKIGTTGAWPFDVEFSGADRTHRYSGGGAAGGNPQNFTRGSNLRKAVRAPEGCKLVVGDFSKVEPRLVAALTKDPQLIEDLKGDVYVRFASALYGHPINKKTDKDEYAYGKEGVLSLGYRMGWERYRDRVKIKLGLTVSEEDARRAVDFYRYRYRGVKEYWETLDRAISKLADGTEGQFFDTPFRYTKEALILPSGLRVQYPNLRQETNKYGRPSWVYDIYDKGKLTKAWIHGGKLLGNMCQSLAGELTKAAIERVEDYTYGQVHDEAILVVPEDRAESMAEALECIMSESPSWLPMMKLGAECGWGSNWLEAKA